MRMKNGTKLEHYEILSPIGAGGMGEVYRARDVRLSRTVAIKVLGAKLTEAERRQILREIDTHGVGGPLEDEVDHYLRRVEADRLATLPIFAQQLDHRILLVVARIERQHLGNDQQRVGECLHAQLSLSFHLEKGTEGVG